MPDDLEQIQVGFPKDSGFTPPEEPTGQSGSLSTDDLAQEGNVEGPEQAVSPDALAEEYKPYSQFPWHQLPDDVRGEFLTKLKKFHGDMTRNSQEVASLRKQADEYQQKAQWFDALTSERWFQDAYTAQQRGGQPTNQPPAPQQGAPMNDLSEYGLDQGATQAIQQIIGQNIKSVVGPLAQQLEHMQRQMVNDQTERDMAELRVLAQSKGWPNPDNKVSEMSKLLQDGRARTVRDAYRLCVFEEVPALTENQARLSLEQELRSKADQTISPVSSPPETPGEQVFTGDNAVLEALNSSLAEINTRQRLLDKQLGR